ncbi:MAG: CFI-box-CTERM domain-containing protein, partial [Candidatus Xenobia bacterium]
LLAGAVAARGAPPYQHRAPHMASQDQRTAVQAQARNAADPETFNRRVGASIAISSDGGNTWTQTALSGTADGSAVLNVDPAPIQAEGFDPVFGDYINVQSQSLGNGTTQVVGVLSGFDAATQNTQSPNVDPISMLYQFSQGSVSGAPATFNMNTTTRAGTLSEMNVALGGAGTFFASSNDFTGDPSTSAAFTSSDGQHWTSTILPPFSNATLAAGAVGQGATSFPTSGVSGDSAKGLPGNGETFTGLGNVSVVVDKLGNAHYVTLVADANQVGSGGSVNDGGIAEYLLAPGSSQPVLSHLIVLHNNTESGTPAFEDKPWCGYDPATDTLYVTWTHFLPNNNTQSDIEIVQIPNASQGTAIGTRGNPAVSAPLRLDSTGATQGSQVTVDNGSHVFVQWQDFDPSTGNTTINTQKLVMGTGANPPTPLITPQQGGVITFEPINENFGCITNGLPLAADGRIRIGPFPGGGAFPGTDPTGSGLRQNTFPLMAIDHSGSATSGHLFTVWEQANPDNGNTVTVGGNFISGTPTNVQVISDSDVFFLRTNPGSLTPDTSVVRVNQNANNGTDQFEPTITVSSVDGSVHVLFFDRAQDGGTVIAGSTNNGGSTVGSGSTVGGGIGGGTVAVVPGGGGGGGGGGCFIATAAYGSYLNPHVNSLRGFRDHVLMRSWLGRCCVATYYRWSPPAAAFIASRPVLRFAVRVMLTPLVAGVEHPLACLATLLLAALAGMQWRRRIAATA